MMFKEKCKTERYKKVENGRYARQIVMTILFTYLKNIY